VAKINFFISNIHFATQLFVAPSTLSPREGAPPSLPYDFLTCLFKASVKNEMMLVYF
jgi:hypothetical protein